MDAPTTVSSLRRPVLPLVGRRHELHHLMTLVHEAGEGSGASVVITGRAGLGKSRLLDEFAKSAVAHGAMVLSATADRGPVLRSHDLVLQLLAAALIECRRRCLPVPPEAEAAVTQFENGGDDLGRASSLTAFVAAVLALPGGPVVLTVDDVHWADGASAEVLHSMAAYVGSIPVVLVRTQRPDTSPFATNSRVTSSLDLAPLQRLELVEVLAELEGIERHDAEQAADTLIHLGGDVPAVLEHLVGAATSSTANDSFLERLSLLGAADPSDVMTLRLASLSSWTREVLSVAAVLGREFDLGGLEEMLHEGAARALGSALDEATERGVVLAHAPGRFRFTHPLAPEELYKRLPHRRRGELHARAAGVLAAAGPQHAVGAALHTLASAKLDTSAVALVVAGGDVAHQRSAFAEAVQLYSAALHHGVFGHERVRVMLALGHALRGVGQREQARTTFESVIDESDDPELLPLAVEAAISHAQGGDFRVGSAESAHLIDRVAARPGLSDAQRARLLAAQARVSARVDRVVKQIDVDDLFALGPLAVQDRVQWSYAVRAPHAHALADEAVAVAERAGDQEALLQALAAWRSVHRSPHVLDDRTDRATRALQLADRLGRRAEGVELRGWLAVDHLERGDRRAFEVVAQQVEATMGRFGNHPLHWLAACLRTLAEQLDGRPKAIADASTAAATVDVEFEVPGRWTSLAILLWRAGELADDRTFARSLSSKHPDIFDQAAAAAMLGLSRARDGHIGEAHHLLERAMDRLRLREIEISWLLSLHAVADLAAELEARALAPELLTLMKPWAHRNTIGNHGTVMLGPMARPLARLMALDAAPGHEVSAMFARARALCDRMRAPAFAAETALDEARWLASTGAFHDAAHHAQEAIRLAAPIGALYPRREAERLLDQLPVVVEVASDLSPRQLEVLRLMAEGWSNPEIARHLAFSLSTVAKETSEIYRRLAVPDRDSAIRLYRRRTGQSTERP